ncbi:MAG: branched-chain amino acid transaminase [Candidatus Latescibacteria bacterium]|jgi:branched-chain amino acid aminotransferase|nr:branched-chain amino acid transaminase [Candidatus Latescibacterota bacterium]
MPMVKAEKIWYNGALVDWDDAKIHVLSHALHYGTSFFEGARCYKTKKAPACFRLKDHIRRLLDSMKIYRTESPYSLDELIDAILDTIRVNKLEECYIRPIVFRGYGELGVNPAHCPLETIIAVWGWGSYLGAEALEKGVNVCVSSWLRIAPNTLPVMAKVGANYMNSQLIKMDALASGFDEGIGLDVNGMVSEGSGENIFLVRDGVIYTPTMSSSNLCGITRNSVITIARDMGITVVEQTIPREMLYIADEVFFTGTAAEVTPVATIDHVTVGNGRRGSITEKIQKKFFDIVSGEEEDQYDWLLYV